ncbi:MAG: Tim44/TimA family putative adaptor protein, partial [Pseudomonadota bacterium]
EIILLAIVAGAILFKLFSVLGQRTGEERQPPNPLERPSKPSRDRDDDKIVRLPGAAEPRARQTMGDVDGLVELQIADRSFEPDSFLQGAQSAYEMIVEAFAAGDRDALKGLLSDDVLRNFETAIAKREKESFNAETQFVDVAEPKIVKASVTDRRARVVVDFQSQQVRFVKNAEGAVVEGDPTRVDTVKDRWTFARDVDSKDPNWTLVATGAAS